MAEEERPRVRRRFVSRMLALSPEEQAKRAALSYPQEDTMHWFAEDLPLEGYESLLGFKREELEGKVVLDLGTSPSDRLAKDLKKAGINATVVGLSPDLTRLVPHEIAREDLRDEFDRLGVAGIAQAMPFRDSSFDVILGAYSVTWKAADYPEQIKAWVSEIARVLKPGGEARVGPNYSDRRTAMGDDFVNIKQYAKEEGLDIEITESGILMKKPTREQAVVPAAA